MKTEENPMMRVAQEAARMGAKNILKFYNASAAELRTRIKVEAGMTPVTIADLNSEKDILKVITANFPDHSINTEESGATKGKAKFIWHIDPLDGTSGFTRNQQFSTVGVALYDGSAPKLAVICRPFQQDMLVAEKNKGAYVFKLDVELNVISGPIKLKIEETLTPGSRMIYVDSHLGEKSTPRTLNFLGGLQKTFGKLGLRSLGTNIGHQAEVALGRGDLVLTAAVGGFFDLAAGRLLVEEAGGKLVGRDGLPVNEQSQVALGGNKLLVDMALPLLKECFNNYDGFK